MTPVNKNQRDLQVASASLGAPAKAAPSPDFTPNLSALQHPAVVEARKQEPLNDPTRTYQGPQLRQPSAMWWERFAQLEPWEAGEMVMLLKRLDPRCVCLEYVGDNGYCPVHGAPPEPKPTPAGSYFMGNEGTRAYVSGGEVCELDGHLIDPDEPSDEEIPYI
jgi:hypothetical protein